ncbi:hypothetical protein [Streptomyces griseorubiginosus]|uniref:hypothetical protein n=1 Tax=Streptomyces griseorubiginosus TaxID=67304 RepID=UPI0036EEC5DE
MSIDVLAGQTAPEALATGAHVQDRDAGRLLAWIIRTVFPTIRLIWADGGHAIKVWPNPHSPAPTAPAR